MRATVTICLAAAGLSEDALQCPPDYPNSPDAADDLVRAGGRRTRVLMNCSGKHAAMLATCVARGWDPHTYRDPDHPLQRHITATIERLAGEPVPHVVVDGCGAPQHALTLTGLARAFQRLVDAPAGTPQRRVADAARRHPHLVGGTGHPTSVVMQVVPGLLAKNGAEGVYGAALPGVGALALKVEDGAWRASPVALVAALRRLGVDVGGLSAVGEPPVLGGGEPVGVLRSAL